MRPYAIQPVLVAALAIASTALVLGSCGGGGGAGKTGAGSGAQAAGAPGSAVPGQPGTAEAGQAPGSEAEAAKAGEAAAQAGGQPSSGSGAGADSAGGQAGAKAAQAAEVIVAVPVIAGDAEGVYAQSATVSATAKTPGSRIVYTLNGSAPGPTNGVTYTEPLKIERSAVFKAVALLDGAKPSQAATREFTIGEVCAAQGGSGDGRRGAPMGSLAAAVAKARSLGIKAVKLAAGSRFTEALELDAPILISGGWKAGFEASGGAHAVVAAPPSDGTSKKAPGYALWIRGPKADAGLRVERIEWRGGASQYSAGIVVSEGAAPAIVDCRAVGGDGSYGYGMAVLSGAAPTVRSSRLSGGLGATGYGLSVDSAQATIAQTFLTAGDGSVGAYGLSATDAKVRASSSVLAGGIANVSYGAALYNSQDITLESCTISGGSGKDAVAVFISASDPELVNCILHADGSSKSYGIVDNYGESAPSRLEAVAFSGCAGGFYYDADARTAYLSIDPAGVLVTASGKKPAQPKKMSCSIAAFALGPADDWKPPAGASLQAGVILSGDAANDVAGRPRGSAWAVGAWKGD